ncbi:MAG: transposase [Bacilli bacterium]
MRRFYWKPFFWHRAYYVGSVGHASLETVKQYAPSQGLSRPGTKTSSKR